MAGLFGKMVFGFKFEDDDFFTFGQTLGSGQHFGAFNGRCTYSNFIVVGYEQDFVQFDLISLGFTIKVYINRLTRSDFILFTTGFNNCVNDTPPISTTLYSNRIMPACAIRDYGEDENTTKSLGVWSKRASFPDSLLPTPNGSILIYW